LHRKSLITHRLGFFRHSSSKCGQKTHVRGHWAMEAQKRWRRLNGSKLLAKVIEGVRFVDGEVEVEAA
jgi:hypothetical protein